MKKNMLTKEWYEKLVQELQELKKVKLPQILERLSDAKAMWDLSENFEYKSALEDKDFVTTRISEIEWLIDNVEIIKEEVKSKWEKLVDYWSKVRIKLENDDEYLVTIVGTWETTMDFDNASKVDKNSIKISFESPMGIAIKWRKDWDIVKMRIHNERKEIKILKIE